MAVQQTIDRTDLHKKYITERDKRLRKDQDEQFVPASGEFERFATDPYIDEPLEREAIVEEVDALIVGAGFGGLLTAVNLVKRGIENFRIIDLAGDFGGTWYWNRYPGVRCDIEAYCYMPMLEETGTIPSERYANGAEIFAHCQKLGKQFGLYDKAIFQTKVDALKWHEGSARWHVTTDRGDAIKAKYVTVSQGPLAKVKLPGIPGIDEFKGKLFHSARWDYEYTGGDTHGGMDRLGDQTVAVIGTGATSVQIVPKLAEAAQKVLVFQRTPSAVGRRNNRPTDEQWFKNQPDGWQEERMQNFLEVITNAVPAQNVVDDCWTDFYVRVGQQMKAAHSSGEKFSPVDVKQLVDYEKMDEVRALVEQVVEDPETAEAMKPWYNFLCKRPLFSDDFMESFNRDNVSLVDTEGLGVERMTETGLVANGQEYTVDAVIFATGFDVGAPAYKVGGYDVIGRDGVNMQERFSTGTKTLHGTQSAGFPNFHIVGGTEQGTTVFNFTHVLKMQAEHATDQIEIALNDGIRTWEVTEDAEARWAEEIEAKHHDLSHFHEECTPGFLNNEGNFRDKPTFVGSTYGAGPIAYEKVVTDWRKGGWKDDVKVTHE